MGPTHEDPKKPSSGGAKFAGDDADGEGQGARYMSSPTLPIFSGAAPVPRGEVSFETWVYNLRVLRGQVPGPMLNDAIRKSLRGEAAQVMVCLGKIDHKVLVETLTSRYGEAVEPAMAMQEFYTSRQLEGESLATWVAKLEHKMDNLADITLPDELRESAKIRQFWTGLRDEKLREALRPWKEKARLDFVDFFTQARKVECEMQAVGSLKTSTKPKTQAQQVTTAPKEGAKPKKQGDSKPLVQGKSKQSESCVESKSTKELQDRISRLEKLLEEALKQSPKQSNNVQCYLCAQWGHRAFNCPFRSQVARGRGASRGRGRGNQQSNSQQPASGPTWQETEMEWRQVLNPSASQGPPWRGRGRGRGQPRRAAASQTQAEAELEENW